MAAGDLPDGDRWEVVLSHSSGQVWRPRSGQPYLLGFRIDRGGGPGLSGDSTGGGGGISWKTLGSSSASCDQTYGQWPLPHKRHNQLGQSKGLPNCRGLRASAFRETRLGLGGGSG